jgi:molybdopterin-guanine dinucleotide biosynthesis protein A
MQASLLVLAGGPGRTGWQHVANTILLRYVAERLAPAFSEVMAAFAEPEQLEEPVPYRVVFDRKRSGGSLAGLEAGLAAARQEVVFAVACNMPYVTRQTAELAVAAARNSDAALPNGHADVVCGAYRRTALPAITAALNGGASRVSELADRLEVVWLEGLEADQFAALRTRDDIERFNAALRSQP